MKKIIAGILIGLAALPMAFGNEFENAEARFNIDYDTPYEEVCMSIEENYILFSENNKVAILFSAEDDKAFIRSNGDLSKEEYEYVKNLILNPQCLSEGWTKASM